MIKNRHNIVHLVRLGLRSYPEITVLLVLMLLYVPLLGLPVLRTTGDEKVYMAQALEMAERGHWFMQSLADEKNYYKGPLHYILIRLGILMFGPFQLWSALWMNLFALACGAWSVTKVVKDYLNDHSAALSIGLALIFAPGVFSHMFASQMEVGLIGFYSLVLFFLAKLTLLVVRPGQEYLSSEGEEADDHTSFKKFLPYRNKQTLNQLSEKNLCNSKLIWLGLWLTIGFCGWLKSPLHSVLLGISGITWALYQKPIRPILFSIHGMISICAGVIVGALGYGIPWLIDRDAFYQTYILRETVSKGANGVGIWESLLPSFTYQIWPFAPFLLVGVAQLIFHFKRFYPWTSNERQLLGLGFFLIWPTCLFFIWHPYRSAIYNIGAIPGILLIGVVLWRKSISTATRMSYVANLTTICSAMLIPLLVVVIDLRFPLSESWWSPSLVVTAWITMLLMILIGFGIRKELIRYTHLSLLFWFPSLLIGGFFMSALGKADLIDFKKYLQSRPHEKEIAYYNLQRFLWSEWGSLNFVSGHKIVGLHNEEDLRLWLRSGRSVIVPGQKYLNELQEKIQITQPLVINEWQRWQSHGERSQNPALELWQSRNLQILTTPYYLVRIPDQSEHSKNPQF